MSGMTTFAERFVADFRAGPVPMVVAENTGEGDAVHTVDALARELGEQRYKDPNVSAFADERGRLATAEYVAADLPVKQGVARSNRAVPTKSADKLLSERVACFFYSFSSRAHEAFETNNYPPYG